jgi:hypothetical protein
LSRDRVFHLLDAKGYSEQIAVYIKAFDYFWENPDDFDGATIVKTLWMCLA